MDASRFPRVWSRFPGKRTGKPYRIQHAENRHHDDVKNFMVKHFLNEEPTCKYQHCANDTDFIKELDEVWSNCLRENLSIVCVDEITNAIAGFLLLTKATPNDEPINAVNEKWAKICNIIEYVSHKAEPFKKLNIQEYLTDLGLLVIPEYRGEGLAAKLLLTCDDICKESNLPATVITFSSYMSQNLAKKIGFQEFYSMTFEDLRKLDNKKFGIDNIEEHTKDIRYMYRSYNNKNSL